MAYAHLHPTYSLTAFIQATHDAIDEQSERSLAVRAEIEAYKKSITACQSKNEQV